MNSGALFVIIWLLVALAASIVSTNDKCWKYVGDKLLGIYALCIIYVRKLHILGKNEREKLINEGEKLSLLWKCKLSWYTSKIHFK